MEYEKIKDLLPDKLLELIKRIQGGDKIEDNFDDFKIRLIPFSSLGKQNGMLVGVKVDNIKIIYREQEEMLENIIIGIYDKKIVKDGKYSALIGLNALERENSKNVV